MQPSESVSAVSKYSRYRGRIKQEVYDAYGGKCYCCDETDIRFMTIDHVNNDGGGRNRSGRGSNLWQRVKKEGFPDTYRISCFNCNSGRNLTPSGVCPHQEGIDAEAQ